MLQLLQVVILAVACTAIQPQYGFVFGGGEWSSPYAKYDSPSALQSLKNMAHTGAKTVRILQQWFQDNINATTVYPVTNPQSALLSPTMEQLRVIITHAHDLGLNVSLCLILDTNWDLDQFQSRGGWCPPSNLTRRRTTPCKDKHLWRGDIGMYFTESEWDAWFASYKKFVMGHAQLAEELKVEMFEAAAEILTTFKQSERWRSLISDVKTVYSGKVTVAANYTWVDWWDAVDVLGFEGYQALPGLTVNELKASWQFVAHEWDVLAKKYNKPVFVTELGYQSRPGQYQGTDDPRLNTDDCSYLSNCVDLQQQEYAYEALFQTLGQFSWWAGIHFWLWRTDPWHGGTADASFSPHGKPAEAVFYRYATGSSKPFVSMETQTVTYPQALLPSVDPVVVANAPHKQNGFVFGCADWSSPSSYFGTPKSRQALKNLADTGANSVRIIVSWYYHNYSSPSFGPETDPTSPIRTPTDAEIMDAIQESNKLKITNIMFAPYLDADLALTRSCENKDGLIPSKSCRWRGELGLLWDQHMWAQFYKEYEAMLLHYAHLAQTGGVTSYCVGTELVTIYKHSPSTWIQMIRNVRKIYKGEVTIAFNRPARADWLPVDLLQELDVVGIDSYYLLPTEVPNYPWSEGDLSAIIKAWEPHYNLMKEIHERSNRSIVFTEVGYQSRPWGWLVPAGTTQLDGADCSVWDQCYNIQAQAAAYEALMRVWYKEDWWAGIYWWVWPSDPTIGGPVDDSFSPRGKLAEEILKRYWKP